MRRRKGSLNRRSWMRPKVGEVSGGKGMHEMIPAGERGGCDGDGQSISGLRGKNGDIFDGVRLLESIFSGLRVMSVVKILDFLVLVGVMGGAKKGDLVGDSFRFFWAGGMGIRDASSCKLSSNGFGKIGSEI